MKLTNCPICGKGVKRVSQTAFCKCGWQKSFNKKQIQKMEHKTVKSLFIMGTILMGLIVYVNNWGASSLSIVPLKVSQWTGNLNPKSFAKLQYVCMKLKRYNCVESAQTSFYRSSGNLTILAELGAFQYRRQRFHEASRTYNRYFKMNGKDIKAAYNYARILEKQGHVKHALAYYEYALKARSGVIQVTIMRSYLDLLVETGQRNRARKVLFKLKPLLKRSGSLVKQEYKRWEKQTI